MPTQTRVHSHTYTRVCAHTHIHIFCHFKAPLTPVEFLPANSPPTWPAPGRFPSGSARHPTAHTCRMQLYNMVAETVTLNVSHQ